MSVHSSTPLPAVEIASYSALWVGGVLYSAYNVYLASDSFGRQLGVEELGPGWEAIGRKKDISDYEWRMWLPFLKKLIPWFFLHHIVAEVLRWNSKKEMLRIWYVCVTSLFIAQYCGVIPLAAMIFTPILLFTVSKIGGSVCCWTTSTLLLLCLSIFQTSLLTEEQFMTLWVSFAWIQLRCVSFCMDWLNSERWTITPQAEDDCSPQILRLLSYTLYLPLMFLGPFVSYFEFEKGINSYKTSWKSLKIRLLNLTLHSARFLGWMAVTEFCLHFFYCNAIQLHHEALPFLDAWTLNGLAYCIGQFFLNKYVVIYGLTGTLAQFDGVQAPPVPRCIAHISMYSDMWRHFDRGFYNFLRSYIYDPLLGRFHERKRHVFLTTVCFAFVFVWHGLSMNIFIWSICNFFGILLETVGHEITTMDKYQQFESKLTPQNVRRWRALATSPLFIMSALTMFFFLGGLEVGMVFVFQVVHGSLLRNSVLILFAYCMCQVSLEIKMFKGNERQTSSMKLEFQ